MRERRSGTGHLRSGQRDLGLAHYEIHVGLGEQAVDSCRTGVTACRARWRDPRPASRRRPGAATASARRVARTAASSAADRSASSGSQKRIRRCPRIWTICAGGADTRNVAGHSTSLSALHGERSPRHAPRCHDDHLFCTACRHGWGEPPVRRRGGDRMDRRTLARSESAERRGPNRLQSPTCTYCATDAYVRSIRRTADEVYFVCDGCEAMWALHVRGGAHLACVPSPATFRLIRQSAHRPWTGPYGGVPPWDRMAPEHFPGAFDAAIAEQRARSTPSSPTADAPTFDNTIAANGALRPHARSPGAHVQRGARERHESRISGARARVAAEAGRRLPTPSCSIRGLFERIDGHLRIAACIPLSTPDQVRLVTRMLRALRAPRRKLNDADKTASLARSTRSSPHGLPSSGQKVLADENTGTPIDGGRR